MLMNNNFMMLC